MSTICNQIVLSVLYHSDDIFWDLEHLFFFDSNNKLYNKKQTLSPMIRHLLPMAMLLLCTSTIQAQVEKTFFQTYDIPDGVRRIYILSPDAYELRVWNGVQLMIETTARLDGGNMDLLGIVIKDGRYNFEFDQGSEGMAFRPKLLTRPNIKHLGRMCQETVKLIMYIPEEFTILEKGELIRKEMIVAKSKNP